jgi:hypothetical protein
MTTPVVPPSKAKTWVALIGTMLMALVPLGLQIVGALPAPWGPLLTGILGVIGLFTTTGVHQAPYVSPGTAVVPTSSAPPTWVPGTDPWVTR